MIRTWPLVGRERAWGQIADLLASGSPRALAVCGPAGIGKSRLAEELVEWLGRQGIAALVARCYATGSALAYAPVVAWLRAQPLPPLADPWLRELARLMPETLIHNPHQPPPWPPPEH